MGLVETSGGWGLTARAPKASWVSTSIAACMKTTLSVVRSLIDFIYMRLALFALTSNSGRKVCEREAVAGEPVCASTSELVSTDKLTLS